MIKNLKLGSYNYYLYTEIEEGRIFGCWRCNETGESGESSKSCENEMDAINQAERHAYANFNINHNKAEQDELANG
jgi:hypothetical protein